MKKIVLIGYSGHAYVLCDLFLKSNRQLEGYCEIMEMNLNPYQLSYLGSEKEAGTLKRLKNYDYFVGIGDNGLRRKVSEYLMQYLESPTNAVHPSAIISVKTEIGTGVMIGAGVIVNPLVQVEDGVICNTGSIIEHECKVGKYSHIAPGAVLCGNVIVGENTLVGASAVIKPGITIGSNVTIGAGAVITKDVGDNKRVVGSEHRYI